MKNLLTLSCISCAVALATVPAFADNSDSASVAVNGTVIAALSISGATDVTMPDLVASDGTSTTVARLSCNDSGTSSLSYGGGGNPFTDGDNQIGVSADSANITATGANSTGTCGSLTVTGAPNYSYAMAVGFEARNSADVQGLFLVNASCVNGGGNVDASRPAHTTTLGSGTDTIYCGVQLQSSGADAGVGAYDDLRFTVTVVYD